MLLLCYTLLGFRCILHAYLNCSSNVQATFPAWPHMGMAFFSVRPISAGDELLINYRLSPPFPSFAAGKKTFEALDMFLPGGQ